ncbi:MAG: lipoyl(octanoyl) transferase LipB [Armatimonadetes bacterium]|nr:lipoyl(octanoyl) transferase LipB [Armatimonadota bacterium]
MPVCEVRILPRISYREGLCLQEELVEQRREGRIPDTLLLLEHPPVITFGRRRNQDHVLASPGFLTSRGVEVFETSRGGDVTYHGPGQLVGYPILDLRERHKDLGALKLVPGYLRGLEEVLIRTVESFGVRGERVQGLTGVWCGEKKIAAIGVHISRWITSHGFALNVNPNLEHFDWIVPCGIHDRGVTSLSRELGQEVALEEVSCTVVEHFKEIFGLEVKTLVPART